MKDYYETQIEVENKLATKIQSLWRGYGCRKAFENYKPKKENKKWVAIKKEPESKYYVERTECKIKCKNCITRNCVMYEAEDIGGCNRLDCSQPYCDCCFKLDYVCKCSQVDRKIHKVKMLRIHFSIQNRAEKQRINKWRDLRCLINKTKKTDISIQRKALQNKYDFKLRGITKMTKEDIIRECVKKMFEW